MTELGLTSGRGAGKAPDEHKSEKSSRREGGDPPVACWPLLGRATTGWLPLGCFAQALMIWAKLG